MALPSNVNYGHVTGRFLRAIADTSDTDMYPDGQPLAGLTIKFTASVTRVKNVTTTPPVTIFIDPIECSTNESGVLVDGQGREGVWLVASSDEDLNPSGWTWTATFSASCIASFSTTFTLAPDQEVDLATLIPVPSSPGTELAAWEAVVAEAVAAQAAAQAARTGAESARDEAVTASGGATSAATTATMKAAEASASATAAADSATTASAASTTATGAATAAADSATTASAASTTATGAATAAETARDQAVTAASSAVALQDKAVAAYLTSGDTKSGVLFAGKADKRAFDARDFGIVPDGSTDNTALIQTLMNLAEWGVVFPQGQYVLSAPIEIPYKAHPFTVQCIGHVTFTAAAEMPYMFRLGGDTDDSMPRSEFWRWSGGILDGASLASEGLRFTGNLTGFDVHGVVLNRMVGAAVHMQAPSHGTTSHDAKFTDIRINAVRNAAAPTTVGFLADGGDWQMSDVYATDCMTFVKSAGLVQATNTHWFNSATVTGDVAFNVTDGGIIADNLYIDTVETGITSVKADGTFADIVMSLSNLFVFQYAEKPGDTNVIIKRDSSVLNLVNVTGRFASGGRSHRLLKHVNAAGATSTFSTRIDATGVRLFGDSDDGIRLGAWKRTQRITTVHTHVSGDGVCIALIPAPSGAYQSRAQQVTFTIQESGFDSHGAITFSLPVGESGTIGTPSLLRKHVIMSDGSLALQRTIIPGIAGLLFGIKDKITVGGKEFYPLYIFANGWNAGYLGEIWAEVNPSSAGFFWMSGQKWETGLTDSSFIWTSGSIA